MTNALEIDIFKLFRLIDNNVGRKVFMQIQRMGSKKIEQITGFIREKFSNEVTPACIIEIEGAKKEEIFADEVRQFDVM